MMYSRSSIVIIIVCFIAFTLLIIGVFYPHWFVSTENDAHTVSMFGAIWCAGDVCYSFREKKYTMFAEPGWLMAGRIIGCFSLLALMCGMLSHCIRMFKDTHLVHYFTTIMLITASFFSMVTGFIFVDKFRAMTSAITANRHDPTYNKLALTYNTLPVGLIFLSALTSVVASIFSGLSRRLQFNRFTFTK